MLLHRVCFQSMYRKEPILRANSHSASLIQPCSCENMETHPHQFEKLHFIVKSGMRCKSFQKSPSPCSIVHGAKFSIKSKAALVFCRQDLCCYNSKGWPLSHLRAFAHTISFTCNILLLPPSSSKNLFTSWHLIWDLYFCLNLSHLFQKPTLITLFKEPPLYLFPQPPFSFLNIYNNL